MAIKKRTSSPSKQKKKWYNIISPKSMGEAPMGETIISELENAIGRNIVVNLMNITGNGKHQNVNITFEVVNIRENNLHTRIIKYNILPTSIKRLVRREKDRIDDSFKVKTKDGISVRIKPILLTRSNTNNSVRMMIRKQCRRFIFKKASETDFENFILDIMEYKFQRVMKDVLRKGYPLAIADIRSLEIAKVKGTVEEKKIVIAEEPEEEKPSKKAEKKTEEGRPEVKEEAAKKKPEVKEEAEPVKKVKTPVQKKAKAEMKKDAKADS